MKNKSTVPTSFANTTVSEMLFHVPYISEKQVLNPEVALLLTLTRKAEKSDCSSSD
jgi:hypothetical protein